MMHGYRNSPDVTPDKGDGVVVRWGSSGEHFEGVVKEIHRGIPMLFVAYHSLGGDWNQWVQPQDIAKKA